MNNNTLLVDEALLSTANGYVGMRANFEEGYKESFNTIRGTYINGLHEIVDVTYGESAYGFPKTAQKMLNVMDAQTIMIYIDGDLFSLFSGEIIDFERELNTRAGYALRNVEWRSPKGHHLKFQIKRMASFEQLELMMIDYTITSINFTGDVKVFSSIEGEVRNYTDAHDPRVASGHTKLLDINNISTKDNVALITSSTKRSKLKVAVNVAHDVNMTYERLETAINGVYHTTISCGGSLSFTKYIVYTDSIRHSDVERKGKEILLFALDKGKEYWYKSQTTYLDAFWKYARVEIEGEKKVEESLNYSIYQLLASAGKVPYSNISAKGLSGEGYEGHYFWDTEIYMIPFFTITNPLIAKNLMKFRFETLDEARKRSHEMGHKKGAKVPWRTISGSECSAYFPAGSAQYHINADVAYAYIQYYLFSSDLEFISHFGFEVIYETARLWLEIGYFNSDDSFFINAVTGPDEYTAIVNNNYYTNAMAKYHLNWTVKLSQILNRECKERFEALKETLMVSEKEIDQMKKASEKMYLPFSEERGINLQDDSFINKAEWDFENTPKDHYPLLLHYHPLTIYRHKVLKQADTVLAHLLIDEETDEIIKNSFNYYERLTTHDSSLSPCIHSMVASRINNPEKAYQYFMKTLRLDLDNLHNNTKDGLHIANAGGAYMTIVYGFGGLRIKKNGLHLKPTKPHHWKKIIFRLNYRGSLVKVTIGETLIVDTEAPTQLFVDGQKYHVDGTLEVKYHGKH